MTDAGCLAWRIQNDRKTNILHQLQFKGGTNKVNKPLRFYIPFRCRDETLPGQKICKACFEKKGNPRAWPPPCGNFPSCYWGLVTEPIRNLGEQINQMAFSPWFFEKVKEHGITTDVIQRARDAWTKATAGLNGIPPIPDMVETEPVLKAAKPAKVSKKKAAAAAAAVAVVPVTVVEPVAVPVAVAPVLKTKSTKIKVVASLKKSVATVPTAVVVDPPPPPPPPTEPKKRKKKAVAVSIPEPVAVLSEEKPVEVEVETIDVIIKELNGTRYYVDTSASKVYTIKNGAYIGRWDSATERMITSIPDSDAE